MFFYLSWDSNHKIYKNYQAFNQTNRQSAITQRIIS